MKNMFYFFAALIYKIMSTILPVKEKKIMLIPTHDRTLTGNIGLLYNSIKCNENYKVIIFNIDSFKKKDGFTRILLLFKFFVQLFHVATSEFIFTDNILYFIKYFRFRKKTKLIQLWHSAGVFKKFGLDTVHENKQRKEIIKCLSHYDKVVINNAKDTRFFQSAFNVEFEKVLSIGIPRVDPLFNQLYLERAKVEFFSQYPVLQGKKLLLYAPTYRDAELHSTMFNYPLDISYMQSKLGEDYVLLLRLHPASILNLDNELLNSKFAFNVSAYPDVNHLLAVSDILITDYSSIIFEFSIFQKPILFYAYDLDEYNRLEKGFYFDYHRFVPGPIVGNTRDLAEIIIKNKFDLESIRTFCIRNHEFTDGKNTERLISQVLENDVEN